MDHMPQIQWGDLESPWIDADLSVWEPMLKGYTPVFFKAKDNIYQTGDPFHSMYIVKKGRVRVTHFSENGSEQHLFIACPGSLFGETSCILSMPYAFDATAITDCEVYQIPSKEVQERFHSNPIFADALLQFEARKIHLFMTQLTVLANESARQRVARVFLFMADRYGRETSKGIEIGVPFTHTEMSSMVNATRVTTNNTIAEFTKKGIIAKEHLYYIIKDEDRLRDIALDDE